MDTHTNIATHVIVTLGVNVLPDAALFITPPFELVIAVEVAPPVAVAIAVGVAPPLGKTPVLKVLLAVVSVAVLTIGVA